MKSIGLLIILFGVWIVSCSNSTSSCYMLLKVQNPIPDQTITSLYDTIYVDITHTFYPEERTSGTIRISGGLGGSARINLVSGRTSKSSKELVIISEGSELETDITITVFDDCGNEASDIFKLTITEAEASAMHSQAGAWERDEMCFF